MKKLSKRATPQTAQDMEPGVYAVDAYGFVPPQDTSSAIDKELTAIADSLANLEVYLFKDSDKVN